MCTNCTSTGMCMIWICSQRPAASLRLRTSANIGAHSDVSNDPEGKWSCNMDLLMQHVTTHLSKCCQESFNYLNSEINCCDCRAKSSTVLLLAFLALASLAFQIFWKISLWTGILPQAARAQHGFTELRVYWDIIRSNQMWQDLRVPLHSFESSSDWLLNNVTACGSCFHPTPSVIRRTVP